MRYFSFCSFVISTAAKHTNMWRWTPLWWIWRNCLRWWGGLRNVSNSFVSNLDPGVMNTSEPMASCEGWQSSGFNLLPVAVEWGRYWWTRGTNVFQAGEILSVLEVGSVKKGVQHGADMDRCSGCCLVTLTVSKENRNRSHWWLISTAWRGKWGCRTPVSYLVLIYTTNTNYNFGHVTS